MTFDPKRLFKKFYKINKVHCGEFCVFYDNNDKQIYHSFEEYRFIQCRIIKYLYENGFRYIGSFFPLLKDVNIYGHKACQPERLSEKDFFSVSGLYETEKVCDSLNSMET